MFQRGSKRQSHFEKIQLGGRLTRASIGGTKKRSKIMRLLKGDGEKLTFKRLALLVVLSITALGLTGILALGIIVAVLSASLPNVHDIDKLFVAQSTTLYDKNGDVLYVNHKGEDRKYVEYDKIAPQLIDAVIAMEDSEFWNHPGFNARGIIRAVINNTFKLSDSVIGGSTITQQYARHAFLHLDKTYTRKLQEIILAVQLEQTFDKKKIMELYLNKIWFGNNTYGIEKAAQLYFDKSAKDLSLGQSAFLAALLNHPNYYNPYGEHLYTNLKNQYKPEDLENQNIDGEEDLADKVNQGLIGKEITIGNKEIYVKGRSDLVLLRMHTLGYITEEQEKAALEEIHSFTFDPSENNEFEAPHFVNYVMQQLEATYDPDIINRHGLQVYTTLDPNLQEIAEKAVKEGAETNDKNYNAKNAALIALDPKTGHIKAMVGSRDYNDKSVDGNVNITTRYVQPGSSFKPIVYAQAFYNRVTPASVVFDTQIKIGNYVPKNFDGQFPGPMSIRKALGQSRNIPAIKAYYAAGEYKPIVDLAEKMGITFSELVNDPNFVFGPALSLGSATVRPLDMAAAYGVFANNGIYHEPTAILKVLDAEGNPLEEWKEGSEKEALDPQIAYLITNILSDIEVRTGKNLTIPNHINAAKTGTSTASDRIHPHDLWTIGYTTHLVTAVWAGNNHDDWGHISTAAYGENTAGPIWKKFMTEALKDKKPEQFPKPEGIIEKEIAISSGKLPGPNTPPDQIRKEVFASFSVPTEIDDSYFETEIDLLCGKLANEYTPEDMRKKVFFINQPDLLDKPEWKKGVEEWLTKNPGKMAAEGSDIMIGSIPTETCPERTAENFNRKPEITILSPVNGSKFPLKEQVDVSIEVSNSNNISRVEYYLEGELQYRVSQAPFSGKIRLPTPGEFGKSYTVTVKAFDTMGYSGEKTVQIITE